MLTGRSPSGATNCAKRSSSTSSTTSNDDAGEHLGVEPEGVRALDGEHGVERHQHAGVAGVGIGRGRDLDDAAAGPVGFDRQHHDRRQPARRRRWFRPAPSACRAVAASAGRRPAARPAARPGSRRAWRPRRRSGRRPRSTPAPSPPSAIHVPRRRRDRIALTPRPRSRTGRARGSRRAPDRSRGSRAAGRRGNAARRSVLDTSSRGTSTRIQSIDSSSVTRSPGRSTTTMRDRDEHLVDALPGVDPGRGVVADDRVQRGAGVLARPATPTCRPCTRARRPGSRGRRPPAASTSATAASTIASRSLGGRDVALADLLPRDVGDHQDHQIERQAHGGR